MRVAFIDDQINLDFIQQCCNNPYASIAGVYTVTDGKVVPDQTVCNTITHVSVCAAIFLSELRSPCELYFIQVLEESSLRGNIHTLTAALDWCRANHMEIMNLSLGTTNVKDAGLLQEKVHELIRNHGIIVAAYSNRNLLTFPAAFSDVIGVKALSFENRRHPSDCVLYRGTKKLFQYRDLATVTDCYNSYAAPAVTARVCDYAIRGIVDPKSIKRALIDTKAVRTSRKGKRVRNTKPVILFDFSDENIAALAIKETLQFFSAQGYEGVCISDVLTTDLCSGLINLRDFGCSIRLESQRLAFLSGSVDSDFLIWHIPRMVPDRRNLRSIDIIVTERMDRKYGKKPYVMTGFPDEEKRKIMLRYLT